MPEIKFGADKFLNKTWFKKDSSFVLITKIPFPLLAEELISELMTTYFASLPSIWSGEKEINCPLFENLIELFLIINL